MNRWALASVALLGGAVGLLHADYVVIKINLAATKEKPDENDPNQPGGAAGVPGLSPGAFPGAGGMPGGMMPPGMPGGMRAPGGGMGQMGPGGRFMPGPGSGSFGPRGPGSGSGQPGAAGPGFGRMPGPGGPGGPGAGFRSGMGQPGMASGPTMPGGPGFGGMMAGRTFTSQEEDEEPDSAPLFVGAVIEVDHKDVKQLETGRVRIKHKLVKPFGETILFLGDEVDWTIIGVDTVAQKYEAKLRQIKKDDPNRAEQFLALANWALEHGLLENIPKLIDEVAKLDAKQPAVIAFQKTRADMKRGASEPDNAAGWRQKLGDFKIMNSEHYALLYDVPTDAHAKSVLDRLERNYQGFFYWCALRGQTPPVPQQRLVAVLVDNPEVFERQHKEIFDDAAMVEDGFYVRRDNLAVLSGKRLDEGYDALSKVAKSVWDAIGMSQGDLLKGKGLKLGPLYYNLSAKAQTLSLVQKAMEEEGERATVTYEGTRQLIAATSLLPRSVELPHWIDFGLASYFETPKGSYWWGTGAPNMTYLVNFKLWDTTKKLDKNPAEALKSVVTDRYFHRIKESKNKENAEAKARTMTWALVYFLAHNQQGGLLRYYQELANQPRDLDLDEEVLLGCFARAFGLVDPKNPNGVDANALNNLAASWYKYIRNTPLEIEEAYNEAMKAHKKRPPVLQSPKFGPNAPGTPPAGGPGGSGGGSSN